MRLVGFFRVGTSLSDHGLWVIRLSEERFHKANNG